MAAGRNLNPQQFFHGTNADLKAGDTLQPARKLGVEGEGNDYYDHRGRVLFNSNDRVYATTDREHAEAYAATRARLKGGQPAVYRVEFEGKPKRGFEDNEYHGEAARVAERLT
jgi:hypothetical protein